MRGGDWLLAAIAASGFFGLIVTGVVFTMEQCGPTPTVVVAAAEPKVTNGSVVVDGSSFAVAHDLNSGHFAYVAIAKGRDGGQHLQVACELGYELSLSRRDVWCVPSDGGEL